MKKWSSVFLLALFAVCFPLAAIANTIDIVVDTPFGSFVDYQLGSGYFEIGTTGDAFKTERVPIGKDLADFSGTERLRILPIKEGKGKIIISAGGRIASTVNVTVKKTALESDPEVDKIWFDNGDVRILLDKTEYDRQNINFYFTVKNASAFDVKMQLRFCHVWNYYPSFDWESETITSGTEGSVLLSVPVDENKITEELMKRLELSLLVDVDYRLLFDDDVIISNWVTNVVEI